ncbi:MAG: hypothetical protein PHQ05_10250 [Sterolibacterium sp.]|nr:hypothetical protein [Sterolibacterium sp.]
MWRPWTPEEDQRVVDMANGGACVDQIADALKRSHNAVQFRISYLRQHLGADALPKRLPDPRQVRIRNKPQKVPGQSSAPKYIKRGGCGEQKPRVCLGCGRTFSSAHCMNRLCNTCRGRSASPYAP